jgi:hypothetical protein
MSYLVLINILRACLKLSAFFDPPIRDMTKRDDNSVGFNTFYTLLKKVAGNEDEDCAPIISKQVLKHLQNNGYHNTEIPYHRAHSNELKSYKSPIAMGT